jgi:hypothetical protein
MSIPMFVGGSVTWWGTAAETAEAWGTTQRTVARWCREGRFPDGDVKKIGGAWRVRVGAEPMSDHDWQAVRLSRHAAELAVAVP